MSPCFTALAAAGIAAAAVATPVLAHSSAAGSTLTFREVGAKTTTGAVVGGTGAYVGARGTFTSTNTKTGSNDVVNLLPRPSRGPVGGALTST